MSDIKKNATLKMKEFTAYREKYIYGEFRINVFINIPLMMNLVSSRYFLKLQRFYLYLQ